MAYTYLDGIEMACAGNISADAGDVKSWDGTTIRILFIEIEHLYGCLWTKYTSRLKLKDEYERAKSNPTGILWDSFFVRELTESIRLGRGPNYMRPIP